MSFRNKILARLNSLDIIISPPAVIADVLPVMGEEGPEVKSLLDSILKDGEFGERILKVANSPFHGYEGRVNNIDQARMILGDNLIKCLVFSISVYDHVVAKCPGKNKEHNRLWLHFLETASAARNLELILRFESADDAYVAGLIHDLGRLFLLAYFGGEAFQVGRLVAGGMTLQEAEREHLGIDHQEIGRMVARRWNLPESLQEIAGNHHPRHAADLDEMSSMTRIVSFSDSLSLSSGEYPPGAAGTSARMKTMENCCRFLNLGVDEIKRVYVTLPDDVLSNAEALGLSLGEPSSYLSGLNSQMVQMIFDLGDFIEEGQGTSRSPAQEERTDDGLESVRAALTVLSDYTTDAITRISDQLEALRLLHQKGLDDEVFERIPAIGESLSESARKISGSMQELSDLTGQKRINYSEDSKARSIEKIPGDRVQKKI
jgi:HD-like signal output (HDOD) protein